MPEANDATMLALVPGQGGVLAVERVPRPRPAAGEVLLRVRAAGVNRADLAQLAGRYPPPPGAPDILGLEVAGEVAELGEGLTPGAASDPGAPESGVALLPGVRASALLTGGGYAQYVTAPAELLTPVPAGWSLAEAAAWPEVAFTAFLNVFVEGALPRGGALLVHGGASGVGTMAILLAKAAGATVYATAGGPDKVAACVRLGADLAFDRRAVGFRAAMAAHGVAGVDVVLDMVGEDYFLDNLEVLRTGGSLVVISTLSGANVHLDLRYLMVKRLRLIGSTLRARPVPEKVAIKRALWERFGAALAAGGLRPVMDRVLPWAAVADAHARMRRNENVGKLALEVE